MVGKKVVHHLMMSAKDAHYVGGLVNGARIVEQWGDVGTELMVYVDGDISLFLWTIVNKKDTIFKYIFWERLDSLPIPECCFHFIWC